ncbi:MAG: mannose-phosphate guanylyltransferase [Rickettsiales bacterium]|jgi:MurNAc alpha-1-phosphate uridylyltransferase|nr:mannose-phosphate guanylyltransferase [Rickettsiales bacterium]
MPNRSAPASLPSRAMVFAAGFGMRMRPLTDTMPKPLVKVGGKALLDHTLDHLSQNGVKKAVVNAHYLGEQIDAHIQERAKTEQYPKVHYSYESEILETGGGILYAFGFFKDAPFFSVNSDILWIDGAVPALHRMAQLWDDSKMDALLLLHPKERAIGFDDPGNFFLTEEGLLQWGDVHDEPPYVFTGIQILSPRLFEGIPLYKFSLRALYDKATGANRVLSRMYGVVHDGEWIHIGTPDGVTQAEKYLAAHAKPKKAKANAVLAKRKKKA